MKLTDWKLDELYQEMLNDVYGTVSICGLEYSAADAWKQIDPTAYRCGFADYIDNLVSDGRLFEVNGDYYDDEEEAEEAKRTA